MGICYEPKYIISYEGNTYVIKKDSTYNYVLSFPINFYDKTNIIIKENICDKVNINHLKYNNLNNIDKSLIGINIFFIFFILSIILYLLYFSIKKIINNNEIIYKKITIFFIFIIFFIVLFIYFFTAKILINI